MISKVLFCIYAVIISGAFLYAQWILLTQLIKDSFYGIELMLMIFLTLTWGLMVLPLFVLTFR